MQSDILEIKLSIYYLILLIILNPYFIIFLTKFLLIFNLINIIFPKNYKLIRKY